MNLRDHLVFWLVPTAVVVTLVLMYFSGNPVLAAWVAPAVSRELGLLENLQALILLAAVIVALAGWRRAASRTEAFLLAAMAAALALLLLEEINYGEHYWNFLTGQPMFRDYRGEELNLHNKFSTGPLKTAGNLVQLVFFVIMPLVVSARAPAWLRYVAPRRAFVLTVFASITVSQLAHYLDDIGGERSHPLGNNIAEFREVFTYYLGLLYAELLAFRRRWPGWRRGGDIAARPG